MITGRVIKTTSGVPLTDSGTRTFGPWSDSPEFPLANEQAPAIAIVRLDTESVQLQWSPESGQAPRADLWVGFIIDSPQPITHYRMDWGDGQVDTVEGYGLPGMNLRLNHAYTVDVAAVTLQSYNAGGLVETEVLPVTVVVDSWWLIQQWRVFRLKGSINYTAAARGWIPDWVPFTGTVEEMNYVDYGAYDGWNWGYQLWLRNLDDHNRPDLTMAPSIMVETGTGEGA